MPMGNTAIKVIATLTAGFLLDLPAMLRVARLFLADLLSGTGRFGFLDGGENLMGRVAHDRSCAECKKNGPLTGPRFQEANGGQCQDGRLMPFRQPERPFGK
jgi:hypothetical protein